ncbi:unnamed protein product [Cyclocybe aegerita]|uniref:Uncharacterized protein n=1 Tax=Cyclocybe aegerita TaxID=1973307 RepID=A0A8S0W9M4_CYCAE|nr:unnamed protein product [Cyclocybe aegerita]
MVPVRPKVFLRYLTSTGWIASSGSEGIYHDYLRRFDVSTMMQIEEKRRNIKSLFSFHSTTMNATTAGPPPLPNPFTPMAFLPPDLAYQSTISVYLSVGTLSPSSQRLPPDVPPPNKDPKFGLRLIEVIYSSHELTTQRAQILQIDVLRICAVSRHIPEQVASHACRYDLLTLTNCLAAPLDIPCTRFSKVFTWLFAVSVPLTSLLFLFRVLAIFHENKLVRAFFCVMWLGVVAGVMTPTQGLIGTNIGPTKYCINVRLEAYITTAGLIPLVNDTLVFLAISWKLMRNTHMTPNPLRGNLSFRAFLRGDYLPAFSRGLLQDGQSTPVAVAHSSPPLLLSPAASSKSNELAHLPRSTHPPPAPLVVSSLSPGQRLGRGEFAPVVFAAELEKSPFATRSVTNNAPSCSLRGAEAQARSSPCDIGCRHGGHVGDSITQEREQCRPKN